MHEILKLSSDITQIATSEIFDKLHLYNRERKRAKFVLYRSEWYSPEGFYCTNCRVMWIWRALWLDCRREEGPLDYVILSAIFSTCMLFFYALFEMILDDFCEINWLLNLFYFFQFTHWKIRSLCEFEYFCLGCMIHIAYFTPLEVIIVWYILLFFKTLRVNVFSCKFWPKTLVCSEYIWTG